MVRINRVERYNLEKYGTVVFTPSYTGHNPNGGGFVAGVKSMSRLYRYVKKLNRMQNQ